MNKMASMILGITMIILGNLILVGVFDNSTNHYVIVAHLNDQTKNTFTFSTVNNEPLTTDFIKKKFDLSSNDKLIIQEIKSITREEKNKRISTKDKHLIN